MYKTLIIVTRPEAFYLKLAFYLFAIYLKLHVCNDVGLPLEILNQNYTLTLTYREKPCGFV